MSFNPTFEITPLGAAVAEALPDQDKVKALQRRFKKKKECVTSAIFPTPKSVSDWYRKHSETVIAVRF
jgi:hypothetical protein